MNIIDNAIKYADIGGEIWIKGEDKGNIVEISIKDNGPGMDKEEVKKIFDKFYRHDKKSRGCGLGLTIAKGIIEAHNGKMWVESNPGAGSKIIFVLPKKRGV
jgi:two-component system sensor histidine kinase VicK